MAVWRVVLQAALGAVLAACQSTPPPAEGIAFRQARFEEMAALRTYRECRDQALALDGQARQAGNPARYLASARLLERCEADLGPEAAGLAPEERMRAYALSVQNYLKGGDIAAARNTLEQLQQAFPGEDLYYADGASFTETMRLLLGLAETEAVGALAMSNVSETVKAELRRARYWRAH